VDAVMTASRDWSLGVWQRAMVVALGDGPMTLSELRALLRRLGHYPSRSCFDGSIVGLERRGLLRRSADDVCAQGPRWAEACRVVGLD